MMPATCVLCKHLRYVLVMVCHLLEWLMLKNKIETLLQQLTAGKLSVELLEFSSRIDQTMPHCEVQRLVSLAPLSNSSEDFQQILDVCVDMIGF